MDQKNLTPLEKIDVCGNLLDKLTDAQGRAKCGYIYIINEFLNDIKSHVLVLEEKVRDAEQNTQNGGISIEEIPSATDTTTDIEKRI